MSKSKLSFEESLRKVVLAEECVGCGACVVVCPFGSLDYIEESPKIVNECKACGICVRVCPRYNLLESALENLVFGRERRLEEDFGVYRRIVVARSTDKKTLQVCQDGGIVTTLLAFALENGVIDGAAVSGISQNDSLYPIPRLATTRQDVLECAGTRYFYSPNLLAFQEGIKLKKRSIAFVGTPCQIQTIRKIQMAALKKYVNALNFTVGLMCTESFRYEGFKNFIEKSLGTSLHDVKKMNIKGKLLITTKSNEVKTIPLTEIKKYARKSCASCTDFSAELSDISVGGLGLSGWTFTILRTKNGEELFREAEKQGMFEIKSVEEERKALYLLTKLSKRKRKII